MNINTLVRKTKQQNSLQTFSFTEVIDGSQMR